MKSHIYLFIALICSSLKTVNAQYQVLRGSVIDKESQAPLGEAQVRIISEDFKDSIREIRTDKDGRFTCLNAWVGRNTVEVSVPEYSNYNATGISLSSGKEGVLFITLEKEFIERMSTVTLKAKQQQGQANNDAAIISTRLFTVDETDRFAGSRGDPARMASNFAGVQGADDSRNDIVVRGNSPSGILWRVEGIDIPNPNHFAIPGTTGGSVSIINNKILGNSDFFTGAFPAEYGNGISGAFDLQLRPGNTQKHEMSSQFGILGWDLLAEGPLNKKGASYLVTYRYSTLSMLGALNVPIGTDALPSYQDASFNLKFPLKNKASFSIFGMGGISDIKILISEATVSSRNLYGDNDRDQFFGSSMGILGATYQKSLSAKSYFKGVVSFNHQQVKAHHQLAFFKIIDTFYQDGEMFNTLELDSIVPNLDYRFQEQSLGMHLFVNHAFNSRSTLKAGLQYRHYWYTYFDSARNLNEKESNYWKWSLRWNAQNAPGDMFIPYVQWKYRWSRKLTSVVGLQSQVFGIGYKSMIPVEPNPEHPLRGFSAAWVLPRLGIAYQIAPKHKINFGTGVHAQTQSPYLYYFTLPGAKLPHLLDMDLTKSAHYILGWDWNMGKASRIKVETYYQQLWDIPIETRPSSFSLANTGSGFSRFFPEQLVNNGKAYNYGAELTVERFFSKGFYYLFSGSLFKAMYAGSDGVWRNSDFNTDYAVNALLAKEITVSKRHIWNIGGKATFAGARRFSPIDSAASVDFREYRELDAMKNTERFGSPYMRFDFRLSYKYHAKKVTHEFAIDLVNVTNRKNILNYTYINEPPYRRINYQLGLLPLFYYKIDFSL